MLNEMGKNRRGKERIREGNMERRKAAEGRRVDGRGKKDNVNERVTVFVIL